MDSLNKRLFSYSKSGMYSFHTPGHKGRKDLLEALLFPDYDLTELPGLDMLHNPQGVIALAQRRAAQVYGAEETYFLVNGATVGNQAMFLALAANPVLRGKKIRIQRQAHRSVIGALILAGLSPEYVPPIIHPDFNLPLGLDTGQFRVNDDEVGAIHLTIPSYYGTVIDLAAIIKERDETNPAVPCLVDQAHGSHFLGDLFPDNALKLGADLVVHSTHKTLAALTQAAMLHVQGERINRIALKQSLELLQSSSPSYLLMASLENATQHLSSRAPWADLQWEVKKLQEELEGSLRILTDKDAGKYGIKEIDWTKILVNLDSLSLGTAEAVEILRKEFRIEPELWDKSNILFMLGIGSRPEDVRLLRRALAYLVKHYTGGGEKNKAKKAGPAKPCQMPIPPLRLSPREAWFAPKRSVPVKEALGQIAGETISVYPPGIPLVALGEEITPFVQNYLDRAENYNWQGWQNYREKKIQVIDF
ncbi:MAG TPA: amino acid decarboxylase [Peptococcaceae bacterium]|nr:amino acid decarboxylase [Peptococcaceae bacterium]